MASDLRDIHRAILLDPYDDVARLAYADALEESGDATRAEFVRSGVRNPGTTHVVGEDWEVLPAGRRVRTHTDVSVTLSDRQVLLGGCLIARRGMVDIWRCTIAEFIAGASALFAATPITEVRFTDRRPRTASYAGLDMIEWAGATVAHLGNDAAFLPYDFFASERESRVAFWRPYWPEADAYAWASRAAVNYGRHRVGLPTLGVRSRA